MSVTPTAAIAPPTARQVLLVQAALLSGAWAIQAWAAWQQHGPVETLEPDSQWLLPLLYCSLRQAGMAEAPLRRYANVYRHNWYKNQLLLRQAQCALAAAGLPVLLLGGAALAIGYYPLFGARPIAAVSAFSTQPELIGQHLLNAGWQSIPRTSSANLAFTDSFGRRLELVSTLLGQAHTAALLARARPLRGPDGPAAPRALSALDQLVLVLAAREAWDDRSRLLWVADAVHILRRLPTGIRPTLLDRARELDLEPAAAEGWRQLHDVYGLLNLERG